MLKVPDVARRKAFNDEATVPLPAAIQVSAAASSLREEKARADDREALLREALLRERDKEDRYEDCFQAQNISPPGSLA